MMVLVSYDVSTVTAAGRKRLRQVSRTCRDYGQRVQLSVFELEVDPAQWTMIRQRLIDLINPEVDSLRFYHLGSRWQGKIEHVGAKPALDLGGPLIF
jgi:CRISPR-associated protein Cas2